MYKGALPISRSEVRRRCSGPLVRVKRPELEPITPRSNRGWTGSVRVNLTPGDRERIVVGQPLPFSIFSAEGSLLLAAGRVVESGRARDVLLDNGSCRDPDKTTWATNVTDDDSTQRLRASPLIAFQSDYRRTNPARGFPGHGGAQLRANNPDHPRVAFYGIRFESLSELDAGVLNGFVHSELALESNSLWQVLSRSSPPGRD